CSSFAKYCLVKIWKISNQRPLPPAYKDHPLKGKWEPKRELHIEPDWLLVYEISGEQCFFARTGTHSDLFGK
ncbi:MAG: type II toxin-antitoxin system YafQ family toxin, partial [Desulfovibrio sp.]|nr:type II toxin-antitoxin system YafQ family toxin [Desulfovibrio sp.]